MPENALLLLLYSVIDLLRGSLVVALPVFFMALAGSYVRRKISAETKWSWTMSALAATFFVSFILLMLAYFVPFIFALHELPVQNVPEIFSPEPGNLVLAFVAGVVRVAIVSAVLSLILMPLEFMGLYFFEAVTARMKKRPEWLRLFIACYLSTLVASAVIIFLVPQAITGFIYFLYFGF